MPPHSRKIVHASGCFIELEDATLKIGNTEFIREWHIPPSGHLAPMSFLDLTTGIEWIKSDNQAVSSPPNGDRVSTEIRKPTLLPIERSLFGEEGFVAAELVIAGSQVTLRYLLQVFPNCRGVRMRLAIEGAELAIVDASTLMVNEASTGIEEQPDSASATGNPLTDTLDTLSLNSHHVRLIQVSLSDQTDDHNELLSEREWLLHPSDRTLKLAGCLFIAEDILTGNGIVFLKEAPLPHERPLTCEYDLLVDCRARTVILTGNCSDDEHPGYTFTSLAYSGGKFGRTAALHQYQRNLRPYVPGRDGLLLSNTWGDRNRDARIQASFMLNEIEAGASLGVDIVQIDDGWECGATSNSVAAASRGGVWEGFYSAQDNFWQVDSERFPDGLEPLVQAANNKGMQFGLWFGPDSSNDFQNWKRDADTILRLHGDYNVNYFKIDGVKVRSKRGEANLHAFFDYVLAESGGRVTFDLDITAETRPGYFGYIFCGPLFVENRYTDWHSYWPHQTLRNLWKLAHYVDPVRLRMEFLNNARNIDLYDGDPLAPACYRPDYLFATVMFSSPLAWFETSRMPSEHFDTVASLIAIWKQHRDDIFGGVTFPIGDAPDGVSWTGFVSVSYDGRSAYILAFRETSQSAGFVFLMPCLYNLSASTTISVLAGDGTASLDADCNLIVNIPEQRRFLFARIGS